jgi:uncharacterized protein involved in propanediol utilization
MRSASANDDWRNDAEGKTESWCQKTTRVEVVCAWNKHEQTLKTPNRVDLEEDLPVGNGYFSAFDITFQG